MKIKISYDSKFSLSTQNSKGESFLTGMSVLSENPNKDTKNIFKKENSFLENIKELNKFYPNYKYADITEQTVLGILCRLAGEVRRLDRIEEEHPVLSLREKITFKNKNISFQNEVMNLHTELKQVQNGSGGIVQKSKENHFLLTNNNISETLLAVFKYKTSDEIVTYLNKLENDDLSLVEDSYEGKVTPLAFIAEMSVADELSKTLDEINFKGERFSIYTIEKRFFWGSENALSEFNNTFINHIAKSEALTLKIRDKVTSRAEAKVMELEKSNSLQNIKDLKKQLNIFEIFNFAGFLFNRKIAFLIRNKIYDSELAPLLNSKQTIAGIASSSGSLTIKDYYANFVSEKKTSFTMPYSVELRRDLFVEEDLKEFNIGTQVGVTKECGELTISLDLTEQEELDLYNRFESAGVATFQLGKKGLAYVDEIILEKQ